jgi:hypothetical protein
MAKGVLERDGRTHTETSARHGLGARRVDHLGEVADEFGYGVCAGFARRSASTMTPRVEQDDPPTVR